MSKISTKIDEENIKLRQELIKLRTELKEIKKNTQYYPIISLQEKNKIALLVQEKLEKGIFSPPKKPLSRSRSPKCGEKKIKKRKSPNISKKNISILDENKENFGINHMPNAESPDFLENKKESSANDTLSIVYLDPSDSVQCDIEALQSLERENKLLRELNNLRIENGKLRHRLKQKTPTNRSKNVSFSKISKKSPLKKHSINEIDHNSSIISNPGKVSPTPNKINYRKLSINKINKEENYSKSPRVTKKICSSQNHSKNPSIIISTKRLNHSKSPSPRPNHQNPEEAFSDVFSFTGSTKKPSNHSKSFLEETNIPKNQRSLILKSPTNLNDMSKSPNVTPRSRHCPNCDNLLHKGLSTNYCEKHAI